MAIPIEGLDVDLDQISPLAISNNLAAKLATLQSQDQFGALSTQTGVYSNTPAKDLPQKLEDMTNEMITHVNEGTLSELLRARTYFQGIASEISAYMLNLDQQMASKVVGPLNVWIDAVITALDTINLDEQNILSSIEDAKDQHIQALNNVQQGLILALSTQGSVSIAQVKHTADIAQYSVSTSGIQSLVRLESLLGEKLL